MCLQTNSYLIEKTLRFKEKDYYFTALKVMQKKDYAFRSPFRWPAQKEQKERYEFNLGDSLFVPTREATPSIPPPSGKITVIEKGIHLIRDFNKAYRVFEYLQECNPHSNYSIISVKVNSQDIIALGTYFEAAVQACILKEEIISTDPSYETLQYDPLQRKSNKTINTDLIKTDNNLCLV